MMLVRCAWHRAYFGWPLLKGVAAWRPLWPISWSDGICAVCLVRFHAHAGPAPLGRLVATVGVLCARIRTCR